LGGITVSSLLCLTIAFIVGAEPMSCAKKGSLSNSFANNLVVIMTLSIPGMNAVALGTASMIHKDPADQKPSHLPLSPKFDKISSEKEKAPPPTFPND
jgi:hypothetical protein